MTGWWHFFLSQSEIQNQQSPIINLRASVALVVDYIGIAAELKNALKRFFTQEPKPVIKAAETTG